MGCLFNHVFQLPQFPIPMEVVVLSKEFGERERKEKKKRKIRLLLITFHHRHPCHRRHHHHEQSAESAAAAAVLPDDYSTLPSLLLCFDFPVGAPRSRLGRVVLST